MINESIPKIKQIYQTLKKHNISIIRFYFSLNPLNFQLVFKFNGCHGCTNEIKYIYILKFQHTQLQ